MAVEREEELRRAYEEREAALTTMIDGLEERCKKLASRLERPERKASRGTDDSDAWARLNEEVILLTQDNEDLRAQLQTQEEALATAHRVEIDHLQNFLQSTTEENRLL